MSRKSIDIPVLNVIDKNAVITLVGISQHFCMLFLCAGDVHLFS